MKKRGKTPASKVGADPMPAVWGGFATIIFLFVYRFLLKYSANYAIMWL